MHVRVKIALTTSMYSMRKRVKNSTGVQHTVQCTIGTRLQRTPFTASGTGQNKVSIPRRWGEYGRSWGCPATPAPGLGLPLCSTANGGGRGGACTRGCRPGWVVRLPRAHHCQQPAPASTNWKAASKCWIKLSWTTTQSDRMHSKDATMTYTRSNTWSNLRIQTPTTSTY